MEQRMIEMEPIHVLGRIVIIEEGHVLLAHEIGKENTHLPGGHVEYNEGIKNAIRRELKEEINGEVDIEDFIGVIEHSFSHKNHPYYELNFIFSGSLKNSHYPNNPKSLESILEFYWKPVEKLKEAVLLPEALQTIILDYFENRRKSLWVSTLESN
jgi:ADP-ribose pyrophosphatase YjhB (NUDIX family)